MPLSVNAFNRCLALAWVYPILAFVLAWVMGGSHLFAGFNLLPEFEAPYLRWLWLVAMVIVMSLALYIGKNDDALNTKAEIWFEKKRLGGKVTYRICCGLLAAAMLWLTGADNITIGAFLVLGYWSGALAFAFAVAFAFAGAGAGAGAIIFIISGNYDASITFALFFIALPLVNAGLDFISWYWSRFFLHQVVKPNAGLIAALSHIVLDLLVALILLFALCVLLPFMVDGINGIYANIAVSEFKPVDWLEHAKAGRDDPWGTGLFVTLMVLTTILPTTVHVIVALAATAIHLGGNSLGAFIAKYHQDGIMRLWAGLWFMAYWLLPPVIVLGGCWFLIDWVWYLQLAQGLFDITMWAYNQPSISLSLVALIVIGLWGLAKYTQRQDLV